MADPLPTQPQSFHCTMPLVFFCFVLYQSYAAPIELAVYIHQETAQPTGQSRAGRQALVGSNPGSANDSVNFTASVSLSVGQGQRYPPLQNLD